MNHRIQTVKGMAKRGLLESFLNPGLYIILSVSMTLGYFLVSGFTKSINSSGFDYTLDPLYDLIGRTLDGFFGSTYVDQLFAEGPFLFIILIILFPLFIYLTITSVFKFGMEKKAGVIELLSYGPVDGTSYFIASLIKDLLTSFISIAVILIFLIITAAINNLALGSSVLLSLALILFLIPVVFSYGILAACLTDNSASSLILFLLIMAFFFFLITGSFTIVDNFTQNIAGQLSGVLNWISPFFFFRVGMRAAASGNSIIYLLSILALCFLSFVILLVSHFVLHIKGVRP